jgi:hemolysin activation/secretion protein
VLVVEVTIKPVDAFGRMDNRGTKARGPMEFMTSATSNNLLHIHDALTVTYAGAFQTQELQYFGVNYRQVLTAEGLTAFVNGSVGYGRPGTPELTLLQYRTKSTYYETGLSFPVIRARERNFNVSGLWFWSSDMGSFFDMPNIPPSTLDRQRGFRLRADADAADPYGGINQLNFAFSKGIEGFGSTVNGNELASRANGRVDFSKVELTLSRLQTLGEGFSFLGVAYTQYALTPLLVSEQCGYGGRVFGRAFDPSQFVADTCVELLGELRFDVTHQLKGVSLIQLYGYGDHGYLHNIAPVPGTPRNVDAASMGAGIRLGWLNSLTADLSYAQIVQGQNLTGTQPVIGPALGTVPARRFFFILTGKL